MPCTTISLPGALLAALSTLDSKYVSVITGAQFMCNVRGYLLDDMLIGTYRDQVASQLGTALAYMSTTIMTSWVIYHGFMIMTGGNKQPVLPLFLKTGKMALIMSLVALIAARSPIIAGWVADFQALITAAVVGSEINLYQMIDINLALAQVFNALVDGMAGGKQAGADGKSLTTLAGLVGQSGPAVLLSVLSLMAEISIVLAIMLAPLFLFFLLFQQTSAMFWTWVKFLLGTMVSLAVVTLVGSIVLDMMMRYGGAMVFAYFVNGMLQGLAGFDMGGSAVQLASLGALSTALLTMVPPLIMQFFNSGASFAAGAMAGAMGGGAAAGAMGGAMPGGASAGLAGLLGGKSAGSLGYQGGGNSGGADTGGSAGEGSTSANNASVLQQVSRISNDQGGSGTSASGSNSGQWGSRGIAAQTVDNQGLAAVRYKQDGLGQTGELRLNEKTGVYETKDTPRQLAENPGLGRGHGSPLAVSGGNTRASTTTNGGGGGAGATTAAKGPVDSHGSANQPPGIREASNTPLGNKVPSNAGASGPAQRPSVNQAYASRRTDPKPTNVI